ncbi:MAG: hypothetical protein FWE74_00185 [Oscillospiraceae bacterium]|nr:hypothetical protein [Oscillospiraceae bacterium]
MKKSIIIFGTGRAGKTTLAKKLNEELNYSVIGTDEIVTAFERSFLQLGIGKPNDSEKTAANLAPFLAHFLGGLSYRSCCHNGTKYVFEGGYFDLNAMLPVLRMYDEWKDNCLLIGLIYPGQTSGGLFNDIRKFDTEDDWTYNLSDNELRSHVDHCIEYSRNFYNKYQKHNPVIYDVSKNREQVLNKIINDIENDLI